MSALRKQARQIMKRWSREELVSEAVTSKLLTEQRAKSLDKQGLVNYLERDMCDPEIVEFIDSENARAKRIRKRPCSNS